MQYVSVFFSTAGTGNARIEARNPRLSLNLNPNRNRNRSLYGENTRGAFVVAVKS